MAIIKLLSKKIQIKFIICIDPYELNMNSVREFHSISTLEKIIIRFNDKNIFCVFDSKDGFL